MKKKDLIWTLIYTKAKQELRAKRNLENQGFEVFLPIISIEELTDISKKENLDAMFPRYLFIRLNHAEDWSSIRSTKGVSNIIFFGQKIAQVPTQLISYLKSKTDKKGVFKQKKIECDFKRGERIKIKKGTFQGMEAIFLSKSSKDRVRLLLKFTNQLTTAQLPASDVGKKEIIESFRM
tara:strand:+ start:96 stop:632 length:537 start_codon:yes stop_codon:yes gene_type:complete